MKINYYPETDSFYMDLSGRPGAGTVEVADHMVVDIDENGVSVSIDTDTNASKIVDLSRLEIEELRMSLDLESPISSRTG